MKQQLEKAGLVWVPIGNQILNLSLVKERPSLQSLVNILKVLFPLQYQVVL